MTQTPTQDQDGTPIPGLRRMRWLARWVLWFERIWPAIAPALGLAIALACAALLDLPALLPPAVHLAALALSVIALALLLVHGLRHIRAPRPAEADRRLEADSGLRHQPLAVLEDTPAAGATPLWAAHVARARAQLTRLRLRAPRPMLAAADPRALRALALLALAASLGIAGPDTAQRLTRAVHPGFTPGPAPLPARLQAWITPPPATGQAPLFLKPDGGAVTIPEGAKLQISLTGGSGTSEPTLDTPTTSTKFTTIDASSFQIEHTLTQTSHITIRRDGKDLAAWDMNVVPNIPPVVRFPEPPGAQRNGTNPQTRLPWEASHAYGVAHVEAQIHLTARPGTPPLTVQIPLPGTAPKSAKGARIQDLTAHPWAGLKVTAQLLARDSEGLEGHSDVREFTLPARRFQNATARAVADIRRQLSLDPTATDEAASALDRLAALPDIWEDDTAGFLNLRAIAGLLRHGRNADTVPEAQSRLWDLALHLEEGAPDRTAKALEAARQQLKDALEAEKRGETADKTELDRRIEALKDAIQKRLEALSEQARRDPDSEAYNPDAHLLDQRDMQKRLDEMRDAARDGDTNKTRDKLAELDQLLDALKSTRPERGQMTEREKQRAQKRERGKQQLSVLQDIVQREGQILDHAQSRATDPQRRRPQPDPTADTQARTADQKTQLALRRAIGELMQQYGDLTGEIPPNLGDADTAMRGAAQSLAQSQDQTTAQLAQRAIEALQKGGKSMQQQMARQFGRGQPQSADDGDEGDGEDAMAQGEGEGEGEGEGDGPGQGPGRQYGSRPGDDFGPGQDRPNPGRQHARRPGQQRDPLGRPRGEGLSGSDEAGDVEVPGQMEEARSRALQDELRRRGADRGRPQQELDYIDRLLKQF